MNTRTFYRPTLLLLSFALIFCLAAIWWFEPTLAIAGHEFYADPFPRLYLSGALFLLWFLSCLWLLYQRNGPKNPLMIQLENRFQKAMEFLQKTHLKHSPKQKLSELPHYLILGPNSSGKTSFLAQSGLKFVLAKNQNNFNTTAARPTEHCDFWASKEAVFIDTGRDYAIHHHLGNTPKIIWQTLLSLIRKTRKHRELNGVILVLSLPELLNWTRSKKMRHENNIRSRLEEINQLFRKQIPVYVCLSKCDKIDGFQEFFASLSRVERQQILGATFPLPSTPERRLFSAYFDEAFENLVQSIQKRTLARLHQEHNPNLRAQLLPFAWQFMKNKNPLLQFIQNTFDSHEAESCLNLRGIYFTSSLQQPPEEMLAQTTVLQFHDLQPHAQAHKSYFIEQVLRKIVFHEAGSIYQKRGKLLGLNYFPKLFLALCAGVALSCTAYWSINFSKNMALLSRANYHLGEYQTLKLEASDPTQVLPALNQLADLKQILGQLTPPWSFVYHQSNPLLATVNTAFDTALQERFLPAIGQQLADQITDTANASQQILKGAVTAYMMLAEPINLKPEFVEQWLKVYWDQSYPNQTVLNTNLQNYLRLALTRSSQGIPIDPNIADAAQQVLHPQKVSTPTAPEMPAFTPPVSAPINSAPINSDKIVSTPYGTITLGG